MKINGKIEITLTPEDVTEIINEWVKKETGKEASYIRFNVNAVTSGYGMSEFTEHKFTGVTVSADNISFKKESEV